MICGGENISCLEVESCLYNYVNVEEVVVFPLTDERLGEVVGAVIYVPEGVDVTSENITNFVAVA